MFARCVTIRLKPNSVAEFNRTLENEVVPLLRKQKGFQDEITLMAQNRTEVLAISLWDQKESAEAYHRGAFPEVQRLLSKVTEESPQIQTYEVSLSTFHKVAARGGASA